MAPQTSHFSNACFSKHYACLFLIHSFKALYFVQHLKLFTIVNKIMKVRWFFVERKIFILLISKPPLKNVLKHDLVLKYKKTLKYLDQQFSWLIWHVWNACWLHQEMKFKPLNKGKLVGVLRHVSNWGYFMASTKIKSPVQNLLTYSSFESFKD